MKNEDLPPNVLDKLIDKINTQLDDNWVNLIDAHDLIGKRGDEVRSDLSGEFAKATDNKLRQLSGSDFSYDEEMGKARREVLKEKEDNFFSGGDAAYMHYDTEQPSEGCIEAIFDTLRDASGCLWNKPDEGFCY